MSSFAFCKFPLNNQTLKGDRVQPGDTGVIMHLMFDPGGGGELSLGQDKCQNMIMVPTINPTHTASYTFIAKGYRQVLNLLTQLTPVLYKHHKTFLISV